MLDSLGLGQTASFMPHGFCFLWTPALLWMYVFSNSVIAASYYSIPFALWYFARRRQDLPYRWIFILFGLFVMACGTTHLFKILVIWQADYWVDASVDAFTAIVSAIAAIALWRIMPLALAIPSRSQLERANRDLEIEIDRRTRSEVELMDAHRQLEVRVNERTSELLEANTDLQRLNRALLTISSCNEVLIHASDESKLLDEMCRIIVETAGYKMAWVGFARHDEDKTVQPITHAGYEAGYMERAQVTWADNERGSGPSGTAIRTQKPVVIRDALADPSYLPWRDNSIRLGYRSILSLPLVSRDQVLGVLNIYSANTDDFSPEEIELLDQLSDDLAFGIVGLRISKLQEQSTERLLHSLEGTITAMAATVEMRDPYTAGHQRRVAALARDIARQMELPDEDIHGIYLAAVIHDLGKIGIPAEILAKPGKLNKLEYEIIQAHPQKGYDILKPIDFPWPIAQMVYQHHEHLDGSGYPNGLKEKEILLGARIIAVADTVEAMSSHRPYRPGFGIGAALDEIERTRGMWYDSAVVDACLKLFREHGYKLPA